MSTNLSSPFETLPGGSSQTHNNLTMASDQSSQNYSEGFHDSENAPTEKLCRRKVTQQEWKRFCKQVEALLRPVVLRYGRITMGTMVKIIVDILGENVSDEDYCYWKGILKMQSNVSTWKNRTLDKLKVNGNILSKSNLKHTVNSCRTTSAMC